MTNREDAVVLIPVYQVEAGFAGFVRSLLDRFAHVVIVDDGSTNGGGVFSELEASGAAVIHHDCNRGKGAALKTGFREILARFPSAAGVVTADADGQHAIEDIVRVAERLSAGAEGLVLGVRSFSGTEPWRSRFGNRWIRLLLRLASGVRVSDAQTGLRGIPTALLPRLLEIPGDRYEYEMRMLADAARHPAAPVEVSIRTVYLAGNASSHFRPVVDSLRICAVLFRFAASGLISCLMDNALYALLLYLLARVGAPLQTKVLVALVVARLASMNLNYGLNCCGVFGARPSLRTYLRYWLLALFIGAASYGGIIFLARVLSLDGLWLVALKIVLDVILFCVSFVAQRGLFR